VKKQTVLLGLSMVTLPAFASAMPGCLSSSASPPNDGGSGASSSSGGSSGSSGGTGSSSGASDGGSACAPADPTALIDDMSGANGTQNATGGYWYTYSDRTVPNSEPPILLSSVGGGGPPGTITPPEGKSFPISDSGVINGCTWGYREATGMGEATWGAGFGMDFLSYPPDGGQVPFNQCDAGQIFDINDVDSGTVGIVQPYNASQWTGIQFWGISFTGKNQTVYVQMDDDRTTGWGGVCNACNSTGGTTNPCSDSFRKSFTFAPTWNQFQIAFKDPLFKPENWSMNKTAVPIHSDKVYNLHFQVTQHPAPAFDLGVAMVAFYK
jgi:hypothetical protein